ncbi:IS110 family transposase, partial [Nocardioides montaniterrae]
MSDRSRTGIYVGVDTHLLVHHVAAIDQAGRPVDDRAFPADAAGYNAVVAWAEALGTVRVAAVEGTNSYGAGLKRVLHAAGWRLQETTPGDKVDRRLNGKSDAADAYTAARAALSGRASAIPKRDDGTAEIVRILQVNRQMLVTQQTQTINQIKA